VQPDLIAIRRERLGMYQGHIVSGASDIVVEILSPSSRQYDEIEKMRLYAAAGVPGYWVVDPDRRQMTIYRLAGDGYEASAPVDGLLYSAAVTEFTVDPEALFADLSGQE
jgi:Uma2 family endonuclease